MRAPLPVMMKAIALPELQPVRLTTACTSDARLGVVWSAPLAPMVGQPRGDQATDAVVRALPEMSSAVAMNVAALSVACA